MSAIAPIVVKIFFLTTYQSWKHPVGEPDSCCCRALSAGRTDKDLAMKGDTLTKIYFPTEKPNR